MPEYSEEKTNNQAKKNNKTKQKHHKHSSMGMWLVVSLKTSQPSLDWKFIFS